MRCYTGRGAFVLCTASSVDGDARMGPEVDRDRVRETHRACCTHPTARDGGAITVMTSDDDECARQTASVLAACRAAEWGDCDRVVERHRAVAYTVARGGETLADGRTALPLAAVDDEPCGEDADGMRTGWGASGRCVAFASEDEVVARQAQLRRRLRAAALRGAPAAQSDDPSALRLCRVHAPTAAGGALCDATHESLPTYGRGLTVWDDATRRASATVGATTVASFVCEPADPRARAAGLVRDSEGDGSLARCLARGATGDHVRYETAGGGGTPARCLVSGGGPASSADATGDEGRAAPATAGAIACRRRP